MTKKNATPKNETDRRLVGIARRCRFSATPKTKPTAAGSELLVGVAAARSELLVDVAANFGIFQSGSKCSAHFSF